MARVLKTTRHFWVGNSGVGQIGGIQRGPYRRLSRERRLPPWPRVFVGGDGKLFTMEQAGDWSGEVPCNRLGNRERMRSWPRTQLPTSQARAAPGTKKEGKSHGRQTWPFLAKEGQGKGSLGVRLGRFKYFGWDGSFRRKMFLASGVQLIPGGRDGREARKKGEEGRGETSKAAASMSKSQEVTKYIPAGYPASRGTRWGRCWGDSLLSQEPAGKRPDFLLGRGRDAAGAFSL